MLYKDVYTKSTFSITGVSLVPVKRMDQTHKQPETNVLADSIKVQDKQVYTVQNKYDDSIEYLPYSVFILNS